MNIKNAIIKSPGYVIVKIDNLKILDKLKNKFSKKLNLNVATNNFDDLRVKMTSMSKSEINNIMIKLLSFSEAAEMMFDAFKVQIKKLAGNEIFLQRRANTIFNIPGKNQRRQWPHYELMSGISPFTFVLWAPFHDLDDDGGIFYIDQKRSFRIIKKEHAKGLVNGPTILNMKFNEKPIKLKYGEAIIFNPFILHGNVNFNSKKARMACSIRFQSAKHPLMQKNSDFFKYKKIS